MMKIAHLTTVHPRYDTRIFVKQCRSLAKHGHQVSLVVADGRGDEVRDGVRILDVGKSSTRARRVLGATKRAYQAALSLDASIYHIHDPELIPLGIKLSRNGTKVVFDAHEDFPKQVLSKHYIPTIFRGLLSSFFGVLELFGLRRLDGVVAANPANMIRLRSKGLNCININNFPSLAEIQLTDDWDSKRNTVCYVGAISGPRGAREIIQSSTLLGTNARIVLAGNFNDSGFKTALESLDGWDAISAPGYLDRDAVRKLLAESIAGLVPLHPTPAYLHAFPVKMFEYMAAGIPVIASNFDLHREVVERFDCGLCVNPLDPREIAGAIDHLVKNRSEATRLGRNGREAVEKLFNWEAEETKLLSFYDELQYS